MSIDADVSSCAVECLALSHEEVAREAFCFWGFFDSG